MLLALGLLVAVAVIGLVTFWPSGNPRPSASAIGTTQTTYDAKVVALHQRTCVTPGRSGCTRVTVHLQEGPDKGQQVGFNAGETSAAQTFSIGDAVRVYRNPGATSSSFQGQKIDQYGFSDFERHQPLILLAILFALLAILVGRWRGLRAIIGLAISFLVVIEFVLPAILDGTNPTGVALIGALTIMLVTIPLVHGLGAKSLAACLGTAASLAITAWLASTFTSLAHLSGISTDETAFLSATTSNLSLHGLLLAGILIAALGVLNDSTVSQSSTVMALRRANPTLGFRQLSREALDVGQDHIAATVNTLVLAYVGASLPILLIFSIGQTPAWDAINNEAVATEIVAILVGSIGLILAVPITTALAATLATHAPAGTLADPHGHAGHGVGET